MRLGVGESCARAQERLGRGHTRRLSSVRSTVTPASTLPTVSETSIAAVRGWGCGGPIGDFVAGVGMLCGAEPQSRASGCGIAGEGGLRSDYLQIYATLKAGKRLD